MRPRKSSFEMRLFENCASMRLREKRRPPFGGLYTIKWIGLNGGVDGTRTRGLRRDRAAF
jgi:hypothetical protein